MWIGHKDKNGTVCAAAPARKRFVSIWAARNHEETDVNASHMSALKQKHAALESKLADETSRPWPDDQLVAQLKSEKLALKDEMARESQPV